MTTSNDTTLESRIADVLWRWKFAAREDREQLIADAPLALLIEWWFPFTDIEFARKRGIWCDGIPYLEVTELNRTTFCMAGVGYFPTDVSPYEINFVRRGASDGMVMWRRLARP